MSVIDKIRRPIALVYSDGFRVGVAVRCNLDNLRDYNERDAVHAADRAERAMVKAAGGNLNAPPADNASPPGTIGRAVLVSVRGTRSLDAFRARVARVAIAACESLEADGYDVRESTPESRLATCVRELEELDATTRGPSRRGSP